MAKKKNSHVIPAYEDRGPISRAEDLLDLSFEIEDTLLRFERIRVPLIPSQLENQVLYLKAPTTTDTMVVELIRIDDSLVDEPSGDVVLYLGGYIVAPKPTDDTEGAKHCIVIQAAIWDGRVIEHTIKSSYDFSFCFDEMELGRDALIMVGDLGGEIAEVAL